MKSNCCRNITKLLMRCRQTVPNLLLDRLCERWNKYFSFFIQLEIVCLRWMARKIGGGLLIGSTMIGWRLFCMRKMRISIFQVSSFNCNLQFQTGGTRIIHDGLSDVSGILVYFSLGDWGATVFNPSLTRAVYTGSVPSPHPEIKFTDGYILVFGSRTEKIGSDTSKYGYFTDLGC